MSELNWDEPAINWDEVEEALTTAEAAKNHYRHFAKLESTLRVVKQAKQILDATKTQQRTVLVPLNAVKAELAELEERLAKARREGEDEMARISKDSRDAQDHASGTLRAIMNDHAAAQSAIKDLAKRRDVLQDEMFKEAATMKLQFEKEQRARVEAARAELAALMEERITLQQGVSELQRQAAIIAGRG
jgi:chromosome segregation ATPase